MTVKTGVLNCHNCAGAIETKGDTKRVDCPYCGASVWAPIATTEVGKANQRLMEILQTDFAAELAQIDQRKSAAYQQGDRQAFESAINDEAKLHAAAFDKIDYWKQFGVDRDDFIAQYREQNVVTADRIFAQMSSGNAGAPGGADDNQQLERYQQAYSNALANQDAQAFARYWRKYMEKSLRLGAGANMTDDEIEYQIMGSMENMLRAQSWVGSDELKSLGFEVIYDAESQARGGRSVACQNCSAPLEAARDAEFVECPFCEAVTHLQLTMSEQAALASPDAADSGGAAQHSGTVPTASVAGAAGGSEVHGQLPLARNTVASAYPDIDLTSPRGRVLTYYFLETIADGFSESQERAIREELKLGEGTQICGICETKLAEVNPPLDSCAACQQPL